MLRLTLAATLAFAPAGGASAAPAPLFGAVADCRALADDAARLACYDRTVGALAEAEKTREVTIVDRSQLRETRRSLFGLALPKLGIFRDDDEKKEEISRIDSTVQSASLDGSGNWLIVLADGARWLQMDGAVIARRPRAGDAVVVRRAALGSFKLSVAGQPAVKARRQN